MVFLLRALMFAAVAGTTQATLNPLQYTISNPAPGFEGTSYPFRGESFDVDSPMLSMRYSQVYWQTLSAVPLPAAVAKRFANSTMGVTGFEVDVLRLNKATGQEESVPAYQSYNHHYSPQLISAAVKMVLDENGEPTGHDLGHGKILEFELREGVPDPPEGARLAQAFVHGNGQEHRQIYHGASAGHSQPIYAPAEFILSPMQQVSNRPIYLSLPSVILPLYLSPTAKAKGAHAARVSRVPALFAGSARTTAPAELARVGHSLSSRATRLRRTHRTALCSSARAPPASPRSSATCLRA